MGAICSCAEDGDEGMVAMGPGAPEGLDLNGRAFIAGAKAKANNHTGELFHFTNATINDVDGMDDDDEDKGNAIFNAAKGDYTAIARESRCTRQQADV